MVAKVINTRLENISQWLESYEIHNKFEGDDGDNIELKISFRETQGSIDTRRLYYIKADAALLKKVKMDILSEDGKPVFEEKVVETDTIDFGGIEAEKISDDQVQFICWLNRSNNWLDDLELTFDFMEFNSEFRKEFLFSVPYAELVDKNLADAWWKKIVTAMPEAYQLLLSTSSIETQQETRESVSTMDLVSALKFIEDVPLMKKYYANYSFETAQVIINAIPTAWELYSKDMEGRWGPGKIAMICQLYFKRDITATTVGRYTKAFREAGLIEIKFNDRTIPIP